MIPFLLVMTSYENWKKYRLMSKKLKFAVVKNDRHAIDISKFPPRINKKLLEVSAPYSKSSIQKLKKKEKKNLMPPTS